MLNNGLVACKIFSSPFSGERFFELDGVLLEGKPDKYKGVAPREYFFDSDKKKLDNISKTEITGFLRVYEILDESMNDSKNYAYISTPEGEILKIKRTQFLSNT